MAAAEAAAPAAELDADFDGPPLAADDPPDDGFGPVSDAEVVVLEEVFGGTDVALEAPCEVVPVAVAVASGLAGKLAGEPLAADADAGFSGGAPFRFEEDVAGTLDVLLADFAGVTSVAFKSSSGFGFLPNDDVSPGFPAD
ncbi:MAG: hypothetical protein KKB37_08695 [Alphaproteobacteria bacterium]|nr:hypothetical protein [Alphaproteobacteria bacterium]